MTLNGAIKQLHELRSAEDMPIYYKPAIAEVINVLLMDGREACSKFKEKSQTNADRIRAMTDEELAEYLDGMCHDLWQMFVKDSQKMWLDWLKQEVEDE